MANNNLFTIKVLATKGGPAQSYASMPGRTMLLKAQAGTIYEIVDSQTNKPVTHIRARRVGKNLEIQLADETNTSASGNSNNAQADFVIENFYGGGAALAQSTLPTQEGKEMWAYYPTDSLPDMMSSAHGSSRTLGMASAQYTYYPGDVSLLSPQSYTLLFVAPTRARADAELSEVQASSKPLVHVDQPQATASSTSAPMVDGLPPVVDGLSIQNSAREESVDALGGDTVAASSTSTSMGVWGALLGLFGIGAGGHNSSKTDDGAAGSAPAPSSAPSPAPGPTVISGAVLGQVTEDAVQTQASGQLSTSNGVAGAAPVPFVAETAAGTYGQFTLNASGSWVYTLDNSKASTNALTQGQAVFEQFVVKTNDGAAQTIQIKVTGSNDKASMAAIQPGAGFVQTDFGSDQDRYLAVAVDSNGNVSATGSATRADGAIQAYTGVYTSDGYAKLGTPSTASSASPLPNSTRATMADGRVLEIPIDLPPGRMQNFTFARTWPSPDGSAQRPFDTSFSGRGLSEIDLSNTGSFDRAYALHLFADGSFLAVGECTNPGKSDTAIALARYTATGQLDSQFGDKGRVLVDASPGRDYGSAIYVDASGNILIAGQSVKTNPTLGGTAGSGVTEEGLVLVRLNAQGALDTSFGSQGVSAYAGRSLIDHADTISLGGDGKIYVGGSTKGGAGAAADAMLARYTASGQLDTSFGPNYARENTALHDRVQGSVAIYDPDLGEAAFQAIHAMNGTYGQFSMDSAGHWTYALNSSDPDTKALKQGQIGTEHFTVQSLDKTGTAEVTIQVIGLDDNPTSVAQLLAVQDQNPAQLTLEGQGGAYLLGAVL